jgi:threonine dehydrogenase-like Zn-dependent dehydrogenase
MRAIVFDAPRQVRLVDDAPRPTPEPGQVLVRCTHAAVCGSNLGPYTGEGFWDEAERPSPPGWTGHENVGVIEESSLEDWPAGTAVLAVPAGWNGFAEYFTAGPGNLARLPEPVEDIAGWLIAQPLATVLRGLSHIDPVVGRTCAVIGQGPIGLIFTHMLSRMGAARVIALDRLPERLEWSRRMGATDTVAVADQDPADAVRRLTADAGAELVIEASGTPAGLNAAARAVGRGGTMVPFGCQKTDEITFPWLHTNQNHTRIICSNGCGGAHWLRLAVRMISDERASALRELITPRVPWSRAADAFRMYADPGEYDAPLKVAIEMGDEE